MTSISTTIIEPGIADPGFCPVVVDRPLMGHRWDTLTFLHWRYEPVVVQALLPPGLRVEVRDGSAWVALVPFVLEVTRPDRPPVPWLSRFPETNVRTYVTAEDGSTGVWFLSLDAARLAAVLTAHAAYGLPYFWSKMAVARVGDVVTYRARRRWPSPAGVASEVAVRIGDAYAPNELTDLDSWLTARFRLYSTHGRRGRFALASHAPWPLHRAEVLHLDDQLVAATGLPEPTAPPLVHWSPGVKVRVGALHRIARP